jgi:tripartite ATP-independent transporter DctP family solute receptor
MNNSKRIKFPALVQLVLVVTCVSIFAADAQAGMMLRFAHYASNDDPVGQTATRFRKLVEHNLGVGIEMHPHRQLGTIQEMLEGVRQGSIDITLAPSEILRNLEPQMGVLNLPFLFRTYKKADRVLDARSEVGRQLLNMLKDRNMKGLAFWEIGFHHISTSNRAIEHPQDLEGLKLRTTSNQDIVRTFSLLGAQPVKIPFGELYMALKAGIIDGQESTINNFFRARLYEVQRHISLTHHAYAPAVLVINLGRFEALDRRQQDDIMEAARDAAVYGRRRNRELEDENINKFRDRGLQVLKNVKWEDLRAVVWDETRRKYIEQHGQEGERLLEKIIREQ